MLRRTALACFCCVLSASGLEMGLSRRALGSAVGGPLAVAAFAPPLRVNAAESSEIRSTKGGVKYRVTKEGACPKADPTGLAGSCRPVEGSFCIIDYSTFTKVSI